MITILKAELSVTVRDDAKELVGAEFVVSRVENKGSHLEILLLRDEVVYCSCKYFVFDGKTLEKCAECGKPPRHQVIVKEKMK